MSEDTHASGFYPANSDPSELRRAIVEQARAQERNVLTFRNHMAMMKTLEDNLTRSADSIAKMTTKIVKLETKMAIYAGLGAVAGGGLTTALSRLFNP